jgi:hypothetical protein
MATIAAPLVVALAGVLAFALSTNGKIVRIGEIAFFVGLLWLVWALTASGRALHF